MQKRIITAYSLSAILPIIAIVILCMRVFAPASRYVAMGIYAAGWIALVLAIRNHRRSHVMQTVDAFRVSWRRPKWDIAQH